MTGVNTRTAAAILLGSLAATGCATKGALREAVDQQQAAWEAALDAERSERMAADERLATDLADLRADLEEMRTEFNAEIEAVAQGLQFVVPVHFAFDDAEVRPSDHAALEAFASVVNRHYTGSLVTVEGFADPAGSVAYNKDLSQRRAEAVRDRLIENGIQAQVRPIGYGEDRLVVPGASKDDPGAELNRRVVFVIESPAQSAAVAAAERSGG
ncbi:MAG: OmpA family protein [Gemmatimonadetes bacterium]|nr:OmpA family protein [Gemmatimonadota bacterium]NIQ53686.1 OmpA family protein [Gemmatimonadota bacterium]NIU73856.1 OmpA family protein [Gammaproteobacteria bacterium]NIX42786.1 OmpA family protein [Gemmatimonadota bacterium]NIY08160.1 OmpA family protein [Gemmatimonadota bacterium]